MLIEAVKSSTSVMGVLRYLGKREAGGSHAHYSRRIKSLGVDVSHFTGSVHNKGKPAQNKKVAEDILVLRSTGRRQKAEQLRRALLEIGVPYICSRCECRPEWLGKPLILDVDHINENWLDDRKENLRFLCPNCHSQFTRKLLDS